MALCLVLNGYDPECSSAPQDRHTEKGVVDLFTGFRSIREGRMGSRICQIQGFCLLRNAADKTLASRQVGLVDGIRIESFGRCQFHCPITAADIDRADFRDHIGCNLHDDLVEAPLGALGLRHNLSEAAQENPGRAERDSHR